METGFGKDSRDMRGWLVPPGGPARKLGKEDSAEVSVSADEMYNHLHAHVIQASGKAEPGWVLGVESVVEEKTVLTQFDWAFQDELPILHSRYSLNLPPGWEARSVTFNREPVNPTVSGTGSGSTYVWELSDLPYVEREVASPELSSLIPRVAVSVLPSGGRTPGHAFTNWTDVSLWLTELNDPAIHRMSRPRSDEKA